MSERVIDLTELPDRLRLASLFAVTKEHPERFSIFEKILDGAYEQLTDGRHNYVGLSEDALTQTLVGMLRTLGINAHHDSQIGGHIDLLVEADGGFRWIGEAKLDNGPSYILGGYDQLTSRYGISKPGADRGEIIIYSRRQRADRSLSAWRDRLLSERSPMIETDLGVEYLAFRTVNICKASGSPFYVRHRIVTLYHQPRK